MELKHIQERAETLYDDISDLLGEIESYTAGDMHKDPVLLHIFSDLCGAAISIADACDSWPEMELAVNEQ